MWHHLLMHNGHHHARHFEVSQSRCRGKRSHEPDAERCPHRVECQRYIESFDAGGLTPILLWMCQTDQYEYRVAVKEGE